MSNPFIEPRSLITELERRRRERFQIGVYAVLGTATVFLAGMLIQGCQNHQQTAADDSGRNPAELATNQPTNPTNTPPTADQSPATNAPAEPAAVAAPAPPSAEPTASAEPVAAQPEVTNTPPAKTHRSSQSVYVVKSGDSLARIAKSHGTTVKALKAANGLKSDNIVAGKKLKIPQVVKPLASVTKG
jgi:LysM repeat protein